MSGEAQGPAGSPAVPRDLGGCPFNPPTLVSIPSARSPKQAGLGEIRRKSLIPSPRWWFREHP